MAMGTSSPSPVAAHSSSRNHAELEELTVCHGHSIVSSACKLRKGVVYLQGKHTDELFRALKFASIWKEKVFPNGVHSDINLASDASPVRLILRRHSHRDEGEVVQGWSLPRLKAGSHLMLSGEFQIEDLHPSLVQDTFFLRGDLQDWGNIDKDYITVVPRAPCRVYMLLPSLMPEPPWLRDLFAKHRDPNMREVTLRVDSKLHKVDTVMFLLVNKYERAVTQHIRVFKSRRVYGPGEQLVVPGPGIGTLEDTMYVLAFAREEQEGADGSSGLGRRSVPGEGADGEGAKPNAWASRGALSLDELDYETWSMRLVKSVKRNRVEEVRTLLMAEAWTLRTKEQRSFVGYLPVSESEVLLSDLAANNRHLEMLALLLQRCHVPLSYRGLKFLVHSWEQVPRAHGTAQSLLLDYLVHHRNPLACCSAILMAIRAEIRQRNKRLPTAQLETARSQFQLLQSELLEELSDSMHRKAQMQDSKTIMPPLDEILDPKVESPLELSDFRPLRVAFEDRDTAFMAVPLVEGFMVQTWLGRDFVAERCKDGTNSLSYADPSFLFHILVGQGFAGPKFTTLEATCRLWHLYMFTGTSFFRSPRGRWSMRLLCSVFYLWIFLQVVGADYIPQWGLSVLAGIALFNTFIMGGVVESVEYMMVRYKSDAVKYLTRQPIMVIYLFVDILMFVLGVVWVMWVYETYEFDTLTIMSFSELWASMSVLVYARILGVLIPLLSSLGPLLNTIAAMVKEIISFAIPWLFITAGFATAFNVPYGFIYIYGVEPDPKLTDFIKTMLMLLEAFLGQFDFTLFDFPEGTPATFHHYGLAMFIIYLVASGILMANLLIALITYKYRPEEVHAQTTFNLAEIIDEHQFQVDHNMVCAPLGLITLAFSWMPRGTRRKLPPYLFWRLGLPPLDGFVQATPKSTTLPTGRDEISHLMYLLTLHPLLMAACNVLFYIHTPFCAFFFASKGKDNAIAQLKFALFGKKSGQPSAEAAAAVGAVTGKEAVSGKSFSAAASMRRSSRSWGRAGSGNSLLDEAELAELSGEAEDPWTRMLSALLSLKGMRDFCLGWIYFVLAFVAGTLVHVCFNGLFVVTLHSLYAWLASLVISVGSILYGCFSHCRQAMDKRAAASARNSSKVVPTDAGPRSGSTISGAQPGAQPSFFGKAAAADSGTGAQLDVTVHDPASKGEPAQPQQRIARWVELASRLRGSKAIVYLTPEEVQRCIRVVFGATGRVCRVTGMPLGNDFGADDGTSCPYSFPGHNPAGAGAGTGPAAGADLAHAPAMASKAPQVPSFRYHRAPFMTPDTSAQQGDRRRVQIAPGPGTAGAATDGAAGSASAGPAPNPSEVQTLPGQLLDVEDMEEGHVHAPAPAGVASPAVLERGASGGEAVLPSPQHRPASALGLVAAAHPSPGAAATAAGLDASSSAGVLAGLHTGLQALQQRVASQEQATHASRGEVQAVAQMVGQVQAQLGALMQQVAALASVVAAGGAGGGMQLVDVRPESAWGTSRQVAPAQPAAAPTPQPLPLPHVLEGQEGAGGAAEQQQQQQ